MSLSPLHAELAILSPTAPAGYLSIEPFARLTVDKLVEVSKHLGGLTIPAGAGDISATLRSTTWTSAPTPPTAVFASSLGAVTGGAVEVDVLIPSDVNIVVELSLANDPSVVLSDLYLNVSDIRSRLRAENNSLIMQQPLFDTKQRIVRRAGAEAAITAAGIDSLELARVEGHIGYGIVRQAITSAISANYTVSLAAVFPAVDFGSSIGLHIIDSGAAIGIVPAGDITLRQSARCTCSEGPDFEIERSTIINSSPPTAIPNTELGKVTIGGPIADNKDPLKDFGLRAPNSSGIAGLYIPQGFAEQLASIEAMPSFTVAASDTGFLGYSASATIAFANPAVTFDVAGGGILIDFDLAISITAYCDMDLVCLRLPIGWAIVLPTAGSKAHAQLGFYPSIDSSGNLRLKGTIKSIDTGSYVAIVLGVGAALKLLGVTAWIGFLVDVVLSAIISDKLPRKLKEQVGKQIVAAEWKLLEGMPLANQESSLTPSAPFDAASTGLLASLDFEGRKIGPPGDDRATQQSK